MPEFTVEELARRVGGHARGSCGRLVRGVAPLDSAGPHELSLVANRRYLRYVGETRAAAVLVAEDLAARLPAGVTCVVVADPHRTLGEVIDLLYPPASPRPGIHPTAIVEAGVELEQEVSIGPYAVVERGARLGSRVRVGPHSVIGAGSEVGADTVIHPHVTLYAGVVLGERCIIHSGARLGSDGFGYAYVEGTHRKIPQVGGCRLGDDVEIGANTTIDRGSIGDTLVGQGSKIDNLVQLGHNVRVGRNVIMVSQVGVAGSTLVEDGAVLAGQAGIGGHLRIGRGARVGAQAGVMGDVEPGATVSGYPARPHREALRAQAALFRLPALLSRLGKLERALRGDAQRSVTSEDTPEEPSSNR
jgi:UDP-3-O-[3-hydroxymyristoyl] glucosamine N-acyltransferase